MQKNPKDVPAYITVFGSWECMYACPGCYHTNSDKWKHNMGDKPLFMPFSTFKRIVEEFKLHKTHIGLYSPGENFLNPDIYNMISYAQDQGCQVQCDTTGAPVDPVRLAETNVSDIIFSIDGMTQEVYGAFRRNGNLVNVQKRLEKFSDEVERRGLKTNIVVKYLVNALTENQMEEAVAYYSKLPNVTLKFDFFFPPEPFEKMVRYNSLYVSLDSYEEWRPKIMKDFDIYEADQKNNIAVHKVALFGEKGPHCQSVLTGITIDTDGGVIPCCKLDFKGAGKEDPMYFGSVFDSGGALGAFQSDRAKRFRDHYREKKGAFYRCENCRHNFSLKEKEAMESNMDKYDYHTMLSGVSE